MIAASLMLSGCAVPGVMGMFGGARPPVSPDLIQITEPGSNTGRPPFFVQWKNSGLPGLTRRPAIDKETKLPEYPSAAIRNSETGTTTLESCLTVEGRLVDTHIVKSSGSTLLDEATLEWTKTAKYLPAEFNGEPFAICGYRFDYEWRFDTGRN